MLGATTTIEAMGVSRVRAALPRPIAAISAPTLQIASLLLLVIAGLASSPPTCPAAVLGAGVVVRAEGRAPVQGGRVDTAYRQALDEAFRRGLLDALRVIAPERQSPRDLETWQETILSRAGDFVGAWRILAQEEQDGFLTLSTELEIYRDKLARAARASGVAAPATAVRVLVLAGSLPVVDRAADEELDAGIAAAVALEGELARRGAIIVATTEAVPWSRPPAPPRRKTAWRWQRPPARNSLPTRCSSSS